MPQAPTWAESEEAPTWEQGEDIPSWEDSSEEPSKPPATFTLGGKEYPLPDQSTRPPMPREVSEFAGLPPETSRLEDLKQTLPGLGDFTAQVMEPTSIAGAGRGITEALITTPEDLKTQAREAGEFRRMAESLGAVPQPERPFTPQVTPEAERELPEGVIFDAALRNELAKGVEELTTGENQAILAATMGAGAIPRIGGILTRIVAGYFGYEGAKAVTEGAKQLREATTPEGKAQAWGNIIKGGAIAIPAGLHAVRPPPVKPRIVEAIAKGDEAGLTKATQTLADTVREQPKQEVQSAEAIRSDPGQVREAGRQPEVVQDQGRENLQQSAPEPSQPVGTQAGQSTEVLLTPREKAIEAEIAGLTAGKGRWDATDPRVEPLKAEMRALRIERQAAAQTPTSKLARIANMPREELARIGTVEVEKLAAEAGPAALPELTRLRDATEARRVEAAKKMEVESTDANIYEHDNLGKKVQLFNEAIKQIGGRPNAKPIPEGQAPVVEQGMGAVPENVPATEASTIGRTADLAEVGPGMGGAKASEPVDPRAQLAQLTDSIATLAKEGKSAPAKAFDLGRALSQTKETVTSTLDGLKAAGQYMKKRLEGKPVATEYRGVLGDRHLALSESSVNARRWMKDVKKAVPAPLVREAISDWVDTGGDPALLTKAASETKPQYKAGYERAQKLTPEEKVVAENLKNYFDSRLQEAIDAGVLEDGIENYIHRAYEAESPWKKGVIQELRSGLFTGQPALAKKRVFEYDFEAEKLGKKPVKDFAQRVAAYDLALNKSIADRAAVKAMMEIKMSDGRPMIDVGGGGKVIEGPTGEATLINRSAKKVDPNDPKADRGDFKPFDHPALRKWKWATEDSAGNPIFVQGDVLIHPEAIGDIRKLLEPSAIRRNPIGRAALGVSSTIKQTMLDLSGFHPVQIAVHGTEHRTFAPVKEIDFTNPDVRGLIRGGAAVGETSGHAAFSEGVSGAGSSLTKHIPWAGERLQAYNSWLFEDYIPRLKVAMGLHALERNRGRYKDLSSDQLYQLTADQMNAAFGEQNYTMLGRSKTTQDALRLALLAPDFLEARGRFAAQAFTKYGAEQRQALILGAVTMYITARLLNKMMTDEYHFEPKNAFNLVVDGKSYGLRTVQGDLIHAATEPGKFINHRLNPVYGKPALEFVTGRDYFGRKREGLDKLKDLAMTPIPIGLRGALDNQEQTLLDTFLNSFGLVTKRDSPSSDIAELAKEWKKDNDIKTGPGEFIYDAEQDPYRPIKLAAERDDEAGARSEIAKAINEGMKRSQIIQHFKFSEKHRFTGSVANERKFLESLTEDQKKIYQDAKQERKRIRELVMRALP